MAITRPNRTKYNTQVEYGQLNVDRGDRHHEESTQYHNSMTRQMQIARVKRE